ncbi:transcriptional regulator [Lentzea pudingi]|uniref:Transcriptional regulator n=1 Tax=Lentzea pudingi TaxID=1789439 RepID=A0ABQ2ITX0_9PSEU|nr:helix-turn-helix transcriptional regulator [Lentzea pudingi]GGN29247.1 transcriptional regulator [Lentzea pudingi]
MTSSYPSQRKRLGELVRDARIRKGYSQEDLGKRIGCKQPKVNKIETKLDLMIKSSGLDKIISELDVAPAIAAEMRELLDSIQGVAYLTYRRAMVQPWFRQYLDAERVAARIYDWTGERISGLLQSEAFMLAVHGLDGHCDVNAHVKSRLDRKSVFDRESPPDYQIILSEGAFHRQARGSVQVMIDEIEYLLSLLDDHPWLSVRVIPFQAPLRFSPPDFTIMEFDGDKSIKDFAYSESPLKGSYYEKYEDRAACRKLWDDLEHMAWDATDSRDFLEKKLRWYREA